MSNIVAEILDEHIEHHTQDSPPQNPLKEESSKEESSKEESSKEESSKEESNKQETSDEESSKEDSSESLVEVEPFSINRFIHDIASDRKGNTAETGSTEEESTEEETTAEEESAEEVTRGKETNDKPLYASFLPSIIPKPFESYKPKNPPQKNEEDPLHAKIVPTFVGCKRGNTIVDSCKFCNIRKPHGMTHKATTKCDCHLITCVRYLNTGIHYQSFPDFPDYGYCGLNLKSWSDFCPTICQYSNCIRCQRHTLLANHKINESLLDKLIQKITKTQTRQSQTSQSQTSQSQSPTGKETDSESESENESTTYDNESREENSSESSNFLYGGGGGFFS